MDCALCSALDDCGAGVKRTHWGRHGKGLAAVIRDRFGVRLARSLVLLLVVANTINLGADIGAMAAAAQLIVALPFAVLTLVFTISIVAREIFMPYAKYVKILKWLTVSLLAYPVTVFVVEEPWSTILRATFVPTSSSLQPTYSF